jgi:hypothetical protein
MNIVSGSTHEVEDPLAATSSSTRVLVSGIEGEINSESRAPSHIWKAHPPQQIIVNLNERVMRSSRSAHCLLLCLSLKMLGRHFPIQVGPMPCMRS